MTKEIENAGPDHIGIRLWLANEAWKQEFVRRMNEAGFDWYTPSRANLLGHVARKGTKQSLLIERLGISKQAVQQLIDGLVADGVLERIADPEDRRGRIVRYTASGLAAIAVADTIKTEIEDALRDRMGRERFEALHELLGAFAAGD